MKPHERFAKARQALGLTQKELAEKLEFTPSTINHIEMGRNNVNPRVVRLMRMIFNVNSKWLVDGRGEMFVKLPTDKEKIKMLEDEVDDLKAVIRRLVK